MNEENYEDIKEDAEDLDFIQAWRGVREPGEEKFWQAKDVGIERWREENAFDEVTKDK